MRLQCAVLRLKFRHDVIDVIWLSWPKSWQCAPSALNANVKKFKKARVNGGSNYDSLKYSQKSLFEPPFLNLGVTYALHQLVGKPVVDYIFVIIELFFAISYGWDVISGNCRSRRFFEEGWVTLNANIRREGSSLTNHCWYRSSRVIALSCGIKISAVRHLVLSQSTHVTDRHTDRQTDGRTDFQIRASIAASLGNKMHALQISAN